MATGKSLITKPTADLIREFADGYTDKVSMGTRTETIAFLRGYAALDFRPDPVPENITHDIDTLESKWTSN